ncbi:MAG: DsbA family oxidoreductase [Desulfovibrionaceae bacterium]|nr:DsbA family oxidoreductase [Desulfovibrionaceae bacterium]
MSIKLTIYSDFVCPFCYVGAGLVEHFKTEFDIEDTWVPHELHPETPPQGQNMEELYNRFDIDNITGVLRQRGAPYGIEFGDMTLLANSRLALEAAEFARDHDGYHAMHMALFKAYFTDGKNIGDRAVLRGVARNCGLDTEALDKALNRGMYAERVRRGSLAAKQAGVTAIPTFVIEGQPPITGAVAENLFREALQRAAKNPAPAADNQ